jgi:hypothetical protein
MPTPSLSSTDLASLKAAGFTKPDKAAAISKPPRISMGSRGKTKSGKSHFALMTTPEPITYITLDPGSVLLCDKAVAMGRQVYPKFIEHSKKETKDQAKVVWQDYRKALRAVMGAKGIRTLVVDTISECWDLLQMAEFGKTKQNNKFAYGDLNAEFAGLIDELYYGRPDLNMVFVQKLKKEYGADDKWDGKSYYAAGYSGFDYLVDLSITHHFGKNPTTGNPEFSFETLSTEATRMGGEFSGLRFGGDECSFLDLALEIFKDHPVGSDPGYWGGM